MTARTLAAIGIAAALSVSVRPASAAEPLQLKYGTPTASTTIYTDAMLPWSQKVNKELDGTLAIRMYLGGALLSMRNALDRVANGVADFAFCVLGPFSSQFRQTLVSTLPFEVETAHEGGLALQRLYDKGIIADEWTRVKPIAFGTFANLSYHTVPRVDRLADMKGLKISVQGRVAADTLRALGGTPITLPITNVYEALQRGTIEGAGIGWPATVSFKLTDIVHHHLRASLGGAGVAMIMNNKTYEKLTGKAKKAIDDNIGTFYTNWFDRVIDDTEHDNILATEHMKNQDIHKLAPAEAVRWRKRIEPVIANWVKATPDGAHVLAAFREEIAKIRAGS